MDITFFASRWRAEELARRICQLVYGDTSVRVDDDGHRWHIGIGNDWWLHDLGGDRWRLVYRYPTKDRMAALAAVLEWRLGVVISSS